MFSPDKWFKNPSTGSFFSSTIDNSVRLVGNSTAASSARLTQTFGTVDSATDFTLNFWIKRNEILNPVNSGYPQFIFNFRDGTSGTALNDLCFLASGSYGVGASLVLTATNSASYILSTNNLFRDFSAWYNIHIMGDLNNGTASEKLKFFINGVEASYATDNRGSYTSLVGLKAGAWTIGDYYGYSYPTGSSIARWAFVDNSTLAASYFGEFKDGVWIPKALEGITWGSAGHLLEFGATGTSQNSSGIGADTSGETNHWAVANIAASDVVPDSPTNNFCTLNPLAYTNGITLSDGNLTMATTTNNRAVHGTIALPSSGKWYVELHVDSYASGGGTQFGWCTDASLGYDEYSQSKGVFFSTYNQAVTIDGSAGGGNYNSQGNNSTSNGDIYQLLLDVDNKVFYIGKNGTYRNSADPANGTGGLDVTSMFTNAVTDIVFSATRGGSYNETYSINFGQDSKDVASANADDNSIGTFEYAVPSGFLALCTSNLPEPTIGPGQATQADQHFDSTLYTGNGGTQSFVNSGSFQPDFVWQKNRSSAANHILLDSVRGGSKYLLSNSTSADLDAPNYMTFNSDGATFSSTDIATNQSGQSYVAWNWKAGGSASSNSDGSITSSVSANTDAGFAVGTFTGNATAGATIGHSLGAIPEVVIVKRRSNARDWAVYHSAQSATPTNAYLLLNSTAGVATGNTAWNNGTFTTDVFTIGSHELVNASGDSYVFYAFKGIEGYSKFGSYVGNSSSDGTFVYLGFRPAWIMLKKIDSTAYNWNIHDTARDTANPDETSLFADSNVAENGVGSAGDWRVDMLSNGFKLRENTNYINQTGKTVVYLAFAEAPFKFANAR